MGFIPPENQGWGTPAIFSMAMDAEALCYSKVVTVGPNAPVDFYAVLTKETRILRQGGSARHIHIDGMMLDHSNQDAL